MKSKHTYEMKNYQTFEVFDIFQNPEIKIHTQKYCKSMKELLDCANYITHLLTMNTLNSSDIVSIIDGKHWVGFELPIKNKKEATKPLKSSCSCSSYDLLRTKGCVCGHIVPYKPFNPFI